MSSGRLFLFGLLVAMICLAAFALLVPGLMTRDPLSFDARIGGYDLTQTRTYLNHLEGRGLIAPYLTLHRGIDSVFPLSLFAMLAAAMWGLWARPASSIALLGGLVSLGYVVADYVENAAVAVLLRAGSEAVTAEAVHVASSATQGKWVALMAAVMLVGLGLLVTLVRGRD